PKHAAACVLPFYLERRTASVRRKRQVSWLVDPRSAAPSHPDGQWHSAASLPTHSGGPAPDLHRTSLFTSAPMARKTAFTVFTCGFIIPARRTGWQEDLEGPIQKGIVAIPWERRRRRASLCAEGDAETIVRSRFGKGRADHPRRPVRRRGWLPSPDAGHPARIQGVQGLGIFPLCRGNPGQAGLWSHHLQFLHERRGGKPL